MKKILIPCILSSLLLTGCFDSNPKTATTDKTVTSKKETKTIIKLSMWDALNPKYDYIAAFEAKHPDIDVQIINIPASDYSQKIQSMTLAGNAPDVLLLWEADIGKYIKRKAIMPLTSEIKGTKLFNIAKFLPSINQMNQAQGDVYGLPWCYATHLVYYNKDMFDKAGVAYPTDQWTISDYEAIAKKLTIKDNNKTVQYGSDAIITPWLWYSLIGSFNQGKPLLDKEGLFQIKDATKLALESQNRLTSEGSSPAPSVSNASDLFTSGKAAMTRQGSWYVGIYRDLPFHWDIAPIPTGNSDYTGMHTAFYTISAHSKHQKAAWAFIEFMLSDEGQALISKGLNNPSARTDIADNTTYQVAGKNGPSHWQAFDAKRDVAQIGQGFINPTISTGLTDSFNDYLRGNKTLEQALSAIDSANATIKRE